MEWRWREGLRVLEAELPGARAAFSTRAGGLSAGPFESLNLGLEVGDDPLAVRGNRIRLAGALGRDPAGFLIGRQVHGAELRDREVAPAPNPYLEPLASAAEAADGQLARSPQLTPIVQVADCLPIALAGNGGVGMLHCGWRGLAAGILARGVEALVPRGAAIGPGIGPCCYEVGEEVLAHFAHLGPGIAVEGRLDLRRAATRLLERGGVAEVQSANMCTSCEPELFFSHRRDGTTGRQAGLVWPEGNGVG